MLWKFKIKVVFKARELWGLVSGEEVKLEADHATELLAYERKERKTLNLLIRDLFDNNS
jgi:hypothetical protein